MTIFNKLSSFAQKTKEHAAAKSILSKDKRLDTSLSDGVRPDRIHFEKMAHFGLETKVAVIAFDTVAGLLAIAGSGSQTNNLRIFGKGVSSTIPLPNIDTIKYMQFKTGHPLLVIIDKKNIIYTIDLKKQHIQHMLPTQGIITSYCYCTGTDWMFIGFADGYVGVFDTRLGQLAKYGIPDLISYQQQQQGEGETNQAQNKVPSQEAGNIVVALEIHPTNLHWLLIGYEAKIFLWDIREQTIHSIYKLEKTDSRLSSLVWHPQTDMFMAGYDDGYLHLWSTHAEHRPVLSRQVFPSLDKAQLCEPVYKLAWYSDDTTQKSYLVVCGGSAIKDIHGLHVLEFDLNQQGDARKQSIIPSDTELLDFTLLWSDPYLSRNPLGIMLLGCNGAVSAHSLDHGYPALTLPPSLAMLHPFITNACFVPMAHEQLFRTMTTLTDEDRHIRHLPLTGGVVGPQHVYRVPSNDLLLTIHMGQVIQFWDASYTSLRPLPQLAIHCHEDVEDTTLFICCIDLNPVTGSLCIGFNNGAVVVYELIHDLPSASPAAVQQDQSTFEQRNAQFISQCDDTINELTGILDEMQQPSPSPSPSQTADSPLSSGGDDDDVDHNNIELPNTNDKTDGNQSINNTPDVTSAVAMSAISASAPAQSDTTNPFLNQQDVNSPQPQPQQPPDTSISLNIQKHTEPQVLHASEDCRFTTFKRSLKSFGYSPDVKIKFDDTIHSIVSAGSDIVACTTSQGDIFILSITLQKVYHTITINDFIGKDMKEDASESDHVPANNLPTVSLVKFVNTYAYKEVSHISTQLLVGLDNGDVYECDILSPHYDSPRRLYRSSKFVTPVLDIHVIDLEGRIQHAYECMVSAGQRLTDSTENNIEQTASAQSVKDLSNLTVTTKEPVPDDKRPIVTALSSPSPPQQPTSKPAEQTNVSRSKSFLRRKSVKKSSKNVTQPPSRTSIDSQEEAWEALSKTSTTTTTSSTGSNNSKHTYDYQQQDHPHFIIVANARSINALLSGYATKLFEFRLPELTDGKDDCILSTMPISIDDVKCLSVLLQSQQVIILSLPHLQPIAKTPLPLNVVKLNESTFTSDGRMLLWSGRYEMQEWMFLHSEMSLPRGHSVELYDNEKRIPPRSSQVAPRATKKTWFGAVAGAFKKEPLSLAELDTLMGRVNIGLEDGSKGQRQKQTSQSSNPAEPSSSTGIRKGGLFKELGDKMNERGDRLNELGQKFTDMNDASGDFLKAVREYNERQAQKKWWEF